MATTKCSLTQAEGQAMQARRRVGSTGLKVTLQHSTYVHGSFLAITGLRLRMRVRFNMWRIFLGACCTQLAMLGSSSWRPWLAVCMA
eukprot:6420697-Amphidinium_carterae.3